MTREVKILCGIPGSGKSTWARNECALLDGENYSTAIISRDKIRFQLLDANPGKDYFDCEDVVFETFVNEINECCALGIDYVVADATHISRGSRMKLLKRLVLDPSTKIIFEVFDCPFAVAMYRNSQREGRECVPVSAMKSMKNGFSVPSADELDEVFSKYGIKNEWLIKIHSYKEG